MRRAARVDGNHAEIVAALRSFPGVSVCSLASLGNGVPDLIVGLAGQNYLVEVKDGEKSPIPSKFDARSRALFSEVEGETSGGPYFRWQGS